MQGPPQFEAICCLKSHGMTRSAFPASFPACISGCCAGMGLVCMPCAVWCVLAWTCFVFEFFWSSGRENCCAPNHTRHTYDHKSPQFVWHCSHTIRLVWYPAALLDMIFVFFFECLFDAPLPVVCDSAAGNGLTVLAGCSTAALAGIYSLCVPLASVL